MAIISKKILKKLVEPTLFILKALHLGKKVLFFLFSKIWKISFWLTKPFIFRPLIKIYGQYLLNLRNLREIKNNQEIKIARFKKYAPAILVALATVSVSLYNLSLGGGNFNISEKMGKAAVASLVRDEFGREISITETIKESYLKPEEVIPIKDKYPTGALTIGNKISLEKDKSSEGISFVQYDYLSTPLKSSVGNLATSGGSRNEVIEYTVENGETISSIAKKFGLSVNTILWANNLTSRSIIRPGNKLTILPQSGVLHKVAKGETLKRISQKYNIDEDKIITANNIENAGALKIGQQLIIPGGQKVSTSVASTKPATTNVPNTKPGNASISGTKMQWPTSGYRITQYYSWRHTGLDIADKTGTPLYAAGAGTVEISGWNSGGYGYQVLINHGNGLKTRYAHASKLYVVAGQKVSRGETIAAMGSTGRSTGPHLHFEVIVNGIRVNPLNYIR